MSCHYLANGAFQCASPLEGFRNQDPGTAVPGLLVRAGDRQLFYEPGDAASRPLNVTGRLQELRLNPNTYAQVCFKPTPSFYKSLSSEQKMMMGNSANNWMCNGISSTRTGPMHLIDGSWGKIVAGVHVREVQRADAYLAELNRRLDGMSMQQVKAALRDTRDMARSDVVHEYVKAMDSGQTSYTYRLPLPAGSSTNATPETRTIGMDRDSAATVLRKHLCWSSLDNAGEDTPHWKDIPDGGC